MERHAYFILLSKGYVDALAAHDTAVDQFTADTGLKFRILEQRNRSSESICPMQRTTWRILTKNRRRRMTHVLLFSGTYPDVQLGADTGRHHSGDFSYD